MGVKSICGVILVARNAEALAQFYSDIFDINFEREEHGGLAMHYGADIGTCHFAIHPPENMGQETPGNAVTTVAFNVDNLDAIIARLQSRGLEPLQELRDEGFGRTVTYRDPEGNPVEIVELAYDFNAS